MALSNEYMIDQTEEKKSVFLINIITHIMAKSTAKDMSKGKYDKIISTMSFVQ